MKILTKGKNYLRAILFCASLGFLCALVSPVFAGAEEKIQIEGAPIASFVAFGHVYPDYRALEKSIEKVNALQPDFIVFLGDTLPNHHQTGWDEVFEITKNFSAPSYFVPGNHDIEDRAEDKDNFEKEFESLYKSFRFSNYTFILLNSSNVAPLGNYDIAGKQLDWLKDLLKKDNNKKIIFVHHCLFYQDENKLCNTRGQTSLVENNWNTEIVPILDEKTSAVFIGDAGTKHPYFSYKENGIQYFGIGFSPDHLVVPPHFLHVKIYEDGNLEVKPIIIQDQLEKIDSLEEKEKPASFRSQLSKFSYDRLRMITIVYLKKITFGLAVLLFLSLAINVGLFLKKRHKRHEK